MSKPYTLTEEELFGEKESYRVKYIKAHTLLSELGIPRENGAGERLLTLSERIEMYAETHGQDCGKRRARR